MERQCLEASVAGHRADFELERERCDTLTTETLSLIKIAMSAREKAARLACLSSPPLLAWRLRGQLDNRFLPATSSQLMRVIRKRLTDFSQ